MEEFPWKIHGKKNYTMVIKNFSLTYYQTRKEVFWAPASGNVNNEKNYQTKLKKNCTFCQKHSRQIAEK